jgi:hypothetical protein
MRQVTPPCGCRHRQQDKPEVSQVRHTVSQWSHNSPAVCGDLRSFSELRAIRARSLRDRELPTGRITVRRRERGFARRRIRQGNDEAPHSKFPDACNRRRHRCFLTSSATDLNKCLGGLAWPVMGRRCSVEVVSLDGGDREVAGVQHQGINVRSSQICAICTTVLILVGSDGLTGWRPTIFF